MTAIGATAIVVRAVRNDLKLWTIINIGSTIILWWSLLLKENYTWLLNNTLVINKNWSFLENVPNGQFVSFKIVKNHQSWKTALNTKSDLCFKKQTHPVEYQFERNEKNYIQYFFKIMAVLFFLLTKSSF